MQKVNLRQKLDLIREHWSPHIVGEVNDCHVKLAKFQGEFVWHHHQDEDELFLVIEGSFRMKWRDSAGQEFSEEIAQGEFFIVPRGVEHCPVAEQEVKIMLLEPKSTLNTGNLRNQRTIEQPQRI
jgi:mannose-6-phosphate isomerase-like protein (cupin superfamily)